MSNTELKHCPFCGGKAEIEETDSRDVHGYVIGKKYRVGCDNLGHCFYPNTGWGRKEDMIQLWNRRV